MLCVFMLSMAWDEVSKYERSIPVWSVDEQLVSAVLWREARDCKNG
jgi:hypothetical protein